MVEAFFGETGPILLHDTETPEKTVALTPEDIDVQSLSVSQWRVCDRRVSEDDVRSLLGFIEEKNGLFGVMELGQGFAWFYFGSLTEAVAHFTSAEFDVAAVEEAR